MLFSTTIGAASLLVSVIIRRRGQKADFKRLTRSIAQFNPAMTQEEIERILEDPEHIEIEVKEENEDRTSQLLQSIKHIET